MLCVWNDIEIMPRKGFSLVGRLCVMVQSNYAREAISLPWVGVAYQWCNPIIMPSKQLFIIGCWLPVSGAIIPPWRKVLSNFLLSPI